MSYRAKDVRRAIRDFVAFARDLVTADVKYIEDRAAQLVHFIHENPIITLMADPLLTVQLDLSAIEEQLPNKRYRLHLPKDRTQNIAYVLQLLDRAHRGELTLRSYAMWVVGGQGVDDQISNLQYQVLGPALRDLENRLNDFLEDEVDGADDIEPAVFQFFSVGNITAQAGSNVAVGAHIHQTASASDVVSEILDRAQKEGLIKPEQLQTLENVLRDIQAELRKKEPSKGVLQKSMNMLYDLGQKGLIAIVLEMVKHQGLFELAANVLLSR